jgi:hypothetical protein
MVLVTLFPSLFPATVQKFVYWSNPRKYMLCFAVRMKNSLPLGGQSYLNIHDDCNINSRMNMGSQVGMRPYTSHLHIMTLSIPEVMACLYMSLDNFKTTFALFSQKSPWNTVVLCVSFMSETLWDKNPNFEVCPLRRDLLLSQDRNCPCCLVAVPALSC